MKTNKKLSKIVAKGTALVLCFAILLFASLMILWDIATPAHAYPSVTCNPPSTCPTVTATGTFSIFTLTPTVTPIVTFTVTPTVTTVASVDVDNSSYTVGDSMTVTLSGFPANTSVSLTVQTSDGSNSHSLNSVTTDVTGASTSVHTAPGSPTGTVEIIANGGSVSATSSTFTINKKAAAPAPAPAAAPPAPAPVNYPPAALAATPTPVPTATPTAVPTDTPTPAPSPTVAPVPTAVPVVVNHNTAFLGGRVPLALAIGLGVLIALGILFVVGRVLLRRYLSPGPLPEVSPSVVPPWMRSQDNSLQQNTMMNGIPFAQTMPFDSSFPPGNGGGAPGPGNDPQPVPFGGPYQPGNSGFAPDPGNGPQPQPVPFGGPYQPGNSGFAPPNVPQESFPPNNWFQPPN